MADKISKEVRSRNMAAIKSGNTKPELTLRQFLYANGIRYRLHKKDLPGKPDIYIKKLNTAIFINGCFWHQHVNCKYATLPKTNRRFWLEKFKGNQLRDKKHIKELQLKGIFSLTVWECEILDKGKNAPKKHFLSKFIKRLLKNDISKK